MHYHNSLNTDSPIVLFMRHAERPEIPPEETGNELNLTSDGLNTSRLLGEQLGTKIQSINASPITRCIETATNIRDAAESSVSIVESKVLGNPGAYVNNEKSAWSNWLKLGSETVLNDLMASDKNPPGLHTAEPGTDALLQYFSHLLQVRMVSTSALATMLYYYPLFLTYSISQSTKCLGQIFCRQYSCTTPILRW